MMDLASAEKPVKLVFVFVVEFEDLHLALGWCHLV